MNVYQLWIDLHDHSAVVLEDGRDPSPYGTGPWQNTRTYRAADWNDAMRQHHEHMGWEPYKPPAPATAIERATELLQLPQNKLPDLARVTRDRLTRRAGSCIETCLTAFAWYAQVCERLPCDDPLYAVDESQPEVVWLRSLACNMPARPGDDDPVDPASGNGITWGHLFGRKS